MESSSRFKATLDQCKTLCTDTTDCQSITYFKSGWCGLFSTHCLRTRTSVRAKAFHLTSHLTEAGEHSAVQEASQQQTGQSDVSNDNMDLEGIEKEKESSANLAGFVTEDGTTASSPVAAIAVGCSVLVVVVAVVAVAFLFWRRGRRNHSDSTEDMPDEYDVEKSQEDVSSQHTADQQE